jgi:DMSO reductase family type II enzyme molybdopterin subunit
MPMGCVQTWGMYNCEGTSDDWFRSDYIVVWIGNPSYTRIPEIHFMHEARYRGAKLVVIAPDYNATAVHADLWINPKPETDAALGLAAAQVIVSEGRYDAEYVREQTDLPILVREDSGRFLRHADLSKGGREDRFYVWDEAKGRLAPVPGCQGDGDGGRSLALGELRPALEGRYAVELAGGERVDVRPVFERLREQLAGYTPEKASAITGLPPALIRRFARELAAAPAAMLLASWGSCKHYHSDLFQRAMVLLMALTANQGKPGGGLRVAAWWGLDGLQMMATGANQSWLDIVRILPKAIRGLTPRDYEQLYTQFSEKQANTPLMPFLYVHGGYREIWSQPQKADPAVPRDMDAYMRASIDRGWTQIHPPEDRRPRVYVFTGCNPLRRWPAPQVARKHLWPKLDLIVAVNFRMSTSARQADYVLPAAGYYEKHGIKYAQSYLPYVIVSDEAVKPLGESKSEWEIFGKLTERIAERARERGVESVRGFRDRPLDLRQAYATWTSEGRHNSLEPVKLMDDILRNSPSVGNIGAEEALRLGAVPIIGPARPTPIYATSSDYDPNDTHWPHRWFVEDKVAWPTLTGRQQFYIDHEWYLEAGEGLPVHKDPPFAGSPYPLRINGGHTRWSVHAIWRDHDLMLRLQRGEPVCFLSPSDCAPRGIHDGDRVRVYNDAGSFEALAKLAPSVQPGEVIIYHAWEPYQFKNWKGPQEPVEAPWKAIHLAGGYGHIHYRMFYGSPGHSPRGAPVEVERVAGGGETVALEDAAS